MRKLAICLLFVMAGCAVGLAVPSPAPKPVAKVSTVPPPPFIDPPYRDPELWPAVCATDGVETPDFGWMSENPSYLCARAI